jgi:glutamine amidotransferase
LRISCVSPAAELDTPGREGQNTRGHGPATVPSMLAIVDYGAGNVASVQKALSHIGRSAVLTADPAVLRSATCVVFPGQGHFGQAMARLQSTGLDGVLREIIATGTPFVGICLGLQLLFEGSDEAPGVPGLGALPGRCVAFKEPLKIPQIGWNQVNRTRAGSAMDAVADNQFFYFVHTYHAMATDAQDVVATADYGGPFTAAVQRGNVFAAQFHPEKSGQIGLDLLKAATERAC